MYCSAPNNNIQSLGLDARTWIDVMRQAAFSRPHELAFRFLGSDITGDTNHTYATLDYAARKIAAALQQAGHEGGRAVLLYQPGADYICALIGCFYAGVTAVPVYAPRLNASYERIATILSSAQASVLLSTADIFDVVRDCAQHSALAQIPWLTTDRLNDALANSWYEPFITPDTLALLQFTSGSTGTPKGVMLKHRNLLANSEAIRRAMSCTGDSVGVIWLPPYHDMGLIGGILQPFYTGFPVHLMSPSAFLQRPIKWLELISNTRGTISSAPNFAYDLCVRRAKPEQLDRLDLSSWQIAANGAEPIRADTLNRFAKTFERCGFSSRAFFPCYGMAETTLYVSGANVGQGVHAHDVSRLALAKHRIEPSRSSQDSVTLVSSGHVDKDSCVRIVDPLTGLPCPPRHVGEIWIKGPGVAAGYWCRPEDTQDIFQANLPGDDSPWLRSGDLGALINGELYVTGRIKDLIIVAGQNHYPHDIENTVRSVSHMPGVHDVAAFSVETEEGEGLVLVVELPQKRSDSCSAEALSTLSSAIRRAVSGEHQLQVTDLTFVARGAIPRTSSGKVQRYLTRARWAQSALPILVSVDANQEALV